MTAVPGLAVLPALAVLLLLPLGHRTERQRSFSPAASPPSRAPRRRR